MVVASDMHVVGREDELALLRGFVSALAQGPRAIGIRGEPGVGKTTLWRAAIEAGETAGLRVLSARCVEAELPLAFVGLSDLVDDAFPAVADELSDHDRAALAVAVGLEAPQEPAGDAVALPRAFSALLRLLARDRPVLVAVDDVQWLDVPSRRALAFAARRLGDAPIGILVTQRGDGRDPLDLARAVDETRVGELRLEPLSLGALAHLIRVRLDVRIPRPALARVHEASGGNPMFALEFARSLIRRGGRAALAPLSVPASLQELVHARIAAQPREIRRLLAVAAAAERPTPSLLAAVDAEFPRLLDAAVDLGVLSVDDDGIVRFTHPLLAAAAYTELAPSQRRTLHARLAEVSEDLEERARHLALSSADADGDVAALLDQAAARAHARGAPDTAAELAQEAVRLTPTTADSDREERTLALARYLWEAGRHADANTHTEALLATSIAGPRRARALLLSWLAENDVEVSAPRLAEALEHVGDDRRLRASVLLGMSVSEAFRDKVELGEKLAREAAALAEEVDDPVLLAVALIAVARRAAHAGRPERALLERALALAEAHGALRGWPTPGEVRAIEISLFDGDLPQARRLLEAELDAIEIEGRECDRARVLIALSEVEWHAGRWEQAERHVSDLEELASYGNPMTEAFALLARGRLAAGRGEVAAARRLLAEASARSEAAHLRQGGVGARWALASLELSLAQPAGAHEHLAEVEPVPTHHVFHLERLHALADTVESLVGQGCLDGAEEVLTELEALARENHVWAIPATSRCRALLLLARGDGQAAVHAAQEAAEGFDAAGFRLDQGRALLVAGEALRRLGKRRRAAGNLEGARAIFTDLGAAVWATRADKELRRARPRPRRDRELTSAERRVAALVAEGKANREVAAQLFTTVATVEAHLTRIYRKLGVRSRTELARRVADGTLSVDED